MPQHRRGLQLRHQPAGPREDGLGVVGGRGPAPLALLVRPPDHDVVRARDDVREVGRGVEVPPLQADLREVHDLAAHRSDRGVRGEQPGTDPRTVHDHVGPDRQGREVQPGDRAAQLLHPRREPGQVHRHLDDRGLEGPRVAVPGRGRHVVQGRDGGTPPRLVLRSREHLDAAAHGHAGAVDPGQPGERVVRAGGPGEHAVEREGAVRVPDRRGHRRGRLQGQVAGQDVDPVALLEQPDGTGQADHPGSDHRHPHEGQSAVSGGRVRRRRSSGRWGRRHRRAARGRRTPRCPRCRCGCASRPRAGRSSWRPPRPAP